MLTGCIDFEQEVSLDSVSLENAMKPRASWIEHKMTEHLVQTCTVDIL